jgi:hypothetical protein
MRMRLTLQAATGEIATKPPQISIHSKIVSDSDQSESDPSDML